MNLKKRQGQFIFKQNIKSKIFILGGFFAVSLLFFTSVNSVAAKTFNIFSTAVPTTSYFLVDGTTGYVGVGTTGPLDSFSIGNSGAAPAGSSKTGHNYTSTYLSTDDYALTNYGLVKTLIANATSTLVAGALWNGTLNGDIWNGAAGLGRVGIGTTAPSAVFHTKPGAVSITGLADSVSNASAFFEAGGGPSWGLSVGYISNTIMSLQTVDRAQTTGSNLALNPYGGNVSIGVTSSAGEKLHVSGTVEGNLVRLHNNSTTTNMTGIRFRAQSPANANSHADFGYKATGSDAGYFFFKVPYSSPERLVINSDGNVGIGNTLPSYVDSNTVARTVIGSTSGTTQGVLDLVANTAGTSAGVGLLQFGNYNNAGAEKRIAIIEGQTNGAINSGKLNFYTNNAGSLGIKMVIDAIGNVGIGTTGSNDTLSIGNSGAAPAGSAATGHNYTSTYLSTDDYALTNYGLVKTLIGNATSTLVAGNLWNGTLNGNIWNGTAGAGNVGIGVTNPAFALDIQSTNSNGLQIKPQTATIYAYANFANTGGNFYVGRERSTTGGLMTGDTAYAAVFNAFGTYPMQFGVNDSVAMTILNGGNIGIGTTAPQGMLQVGTVNWGTPNTTYKHVFFNNIDIMGRPASTDNYIISNATFDTSPGWYRTLTGYSSYMRMANGGFSLYSGDTGNAGTVPTFTEALTILTGGNVGVGITNPAYKFEVASDITDYTGQIVAKSTSATNVGYAGFVGLGTNSRGLYMTMGDTSLTSWYGAHAGDGTIATTANAKLHLRAGAVDTGGITIATDGKVGIGTTAPNDTFSISNAGAAPAGSAATGHNFTSTYLGTDNYALVNYGLVNTLIAAATSSMPSGTNFWGGTKNANIWNGDAGVGNVGIGTTDPAGYKLNINGTGYYSGDLTIADDHALRSSGGGASLASRASADGKIAFGSGTPTDYLVLNSGGTERLRITTTGNVGIGLTPTGLLDLYRATDGTGIKIQTGAYGGGYLTIFGEDKNLAGTVSSYDHTERFNMKTTNMNGGAGADRTMIAVHREGWSNGDEISLLPSGGNVGIGTTAPDYSLTVYNAGNSVYSNWKRSTGSLLVGSEAAGGAIYTNAAIPLIFYTNNVEAMRILSGGNVGISTTAPNDKLSIGNSGAAPAGSSATGHNYTSTYLSTDDYALTNYGIVKTLIANATSSLFNGDLNMGGHNILNVNKLTVNTIDPLYDINGVKYSTYAGSISGGVKEETVGKVKISTRAAASSEYEKVINFSDEKEGTDLWVWRSVIDFAPENVEVFLTPYGGYANTYYLIKDNQLIFRSDRPITLSYRLIGSRFDWRKWPTRALNQNEKGMRVE